jgi:large repetitive protein
MAKIRKGRTKSAALNKVASSHLLALEPRMMFDGAAVATAAEAIDTIHSQALAPEALAPDKAVDRLARIDAKDIMWLNTEYARMPAQFERFSSRDMQLVDDMGLSVKFWNGEPISERMPDEIGNEQHGGAVSAEAVTTSNDIIFIDTNVAAYDVLVQEWQGKGTIVLIDGSADGVDQVRLALAGQSNIGAIHIVSHGAEGAFFLGTTRVDSEALNTSLSGTFAAIGRSLSANGDIFLYGCDVGAGDTGRALINDLARLTEADVAASIDDTGATIRNANWNLERTFGLIDNDALYSFSWGGLLAPTTISVAPNSLIVRDSTGTIISQGGTNFPGGRSPGQVAGATAVWANAGSIGGQAIDLRATVVSITSGATVQFDRPVSGVDNPAFLVVAGSATGLVSAEIRWETFIAGTTTPITGDVTYSIADIDGVGGNPNSRERIRVDTATLSSYTLDNPTNVNVVNSPGLVTASGTQDESGGQRSAIKLAWVNTASYTITYDLYPAAAGTAGFSHDGDNDFAFSSSATQVSIPRLDLDANDSTLAGTGSIKTWVENGTAIPISDSDVTVTNPIGTVQSGTIKLTNAQTGDVISLGTLPTGITGVINTSVAGEITVTLTGTASAASYQQAFAAVLFRNTTERPSSVDRNVNFSFTNGTLSSNIAVGTIRVTEVNDPPVAVNDTASTNEDTAVTISVLTNDTDLDGDPLTVTAATASNGTVVRNANGTITYTPNANFNGTDTITYTISDGRGGTSTATVTVTIAPVNDAPVIGNESIAIKENSGPTIVNVLANDSDPDGTLTVSAVSATNGVATINPDGTVSYTPNPGFNGTDTVTYTVRDPLGGTGTGTITVTVAPYDQAPIIHLTNDPGFGTNVRSVVWSSNTPAGTADATISRTDLIGSALPLAAGAGVTANTASFAPTARVVTGASTTSLTAAINANDYIQTQFTTAAGLPNDTKITQFSQTIVGNVQQSIDSYPYQIAVLVSTDPNFTNYDVLLRDRSVTFTAGGGQFQDLVLGTDAPYELAAGTTYYVRSYIYNVTSASGLAIWDDFSVGLTGTDDTFENTFTENGPAVAISSAALSSLTDIDDTNMESARVQITNAQAGDVLQISGALPAGITATYNAATATMTLSGSASEADYRTAINSIRFNNTSDTPSTVNRNISAIVNDGERDSQASTSVIRVIPVNDPPVPVGTLPAQTNFDAAVVSVATATGFTDPDNTTLTYSATGLPAGLTINATTGVISGTINRSASQSNGGAYNIVVTATDAGGLSATQAFRWTVTNPGPTANNDTASTTEDTPVTVAVLANDSDPDGDPITVTAASATNGTVVINANGTVTYTPNANFNGTDTITYTISDGQGGTSTARVTVTVPAVNDPPVPVGTLPSQTNLDAATGISVATAGGFNDIDNPTLTYSATGLPAGLSINTTTGVISGTIDRSASQIGGGVYSITVTATDSGGLSASQKFTWTVTNPAPTATNNTATTAEDTAIASINVLGNDSDPDGDPLTVVSASAANGTVTINGDGTLRYVPNANFNGTDTITYRISDGQGGFATAVVTVTVTAVNDAPVASTIPPRANADAAVVSVPVASFFSDPDGNTLTYSATGLPAGLSINPATGVISGTIDRSASQVAGGVYSVSVTASDGNGGTVTSTFAWTITNPGPVAANDTASTNEDTAVAINVLANDSDPDGDPLTVTSATAANGTVTIGAGGVLTYTPNAGYNGTDTITYKISDGQGGVATATVAVTINAVNDLPTATPLANQTNLDGQAISLPVGTAFSDPDGDVLSFAATGLPAGLTINAATGVISGTINRSASQVNGGVYSITVTASDGKGGTVSQTFTWNISNPAPVAANDTASGNEDTPLRIDVLANDRDPDGDPLTVTSASAGNGTVTINPDGSLTYVPNANFNGTDTIIYTITDSEGGVSTAQVSIAVRPINDAPTTTGLGDQSDPDISTVSVPTGPAFSDLDGDVLTFAATGLPPGLTIDLNTGLITGTLVAGSSNGGPNGDGNYPVTVFATDPSGVTVQATFIWRVQNIPPVANDDVTITNEDTAVTYAVLSNDTDANNDPLRVTSAIATNGTVVINGDNTVTFTPDPDFTGVATVTYNITDTRGAVATATLTITVRAVNDRPDSVAIPNATNQDNQPITVDASSFFSDRDGDTLRFSATGLPAGLSIDAAGNITGTIDKNASQPNGGVYTVTVTATDPGGLATSQTFTWTVTNPAPTAVNDTATTAEDTPVTIPVLPNDTDPDGDRLTVTVATASNGTVTINPDGTLRYVPNANFNGTDSIVYTISDGNGGFSTAAVTVTVTSTNDAPVAVNDVARTNEDTPVRVTVLANDTDADGDPLTVTAASAPNGTVVINPDGTITYTPRANFNGTDTITYTISDGKGGTSTATVTVTVDPVNDPPVATNDTATTNEDTPVTVAVLANDTDIDGDPLTVVSATAANGTVVINPNGTITYTPNANFNGTDTITYQISDGKGGFSTATVTVTVVPVNDAPVANPPLAPQANPDGTAVSVPTAATFSDPDGDVLTYSATGLPAGLSINATTGVISGTIDRSASQLNGGIYSVTVTASDGKGGTVTSTFGWTVTNPAPTAANDTATTNEDTPVTISVLTNDTDPDGDPLSVISATAPNGTVVINGDGTITYKPALNFNGIDTITYTISDGQGGTSTATVEVKVTAVNDAPTVVSPIPAQNDVDAANVSVPVAGNFTDLDGNTLSFTATGLPAGLSINPTTGVISGTIDRNASQPNGGVYSVTVTASDGNGGTVSTTFTWNVTNPGPTAVDDVITIAEDPGAPVVISVLANDTDPDGDTLTVTTASAPNGTVVINPNGTISYTPRLNFNGTDVITYTISDGNGGTSTATVTVTVTPVNDAPTVVSPIPAQNNRDGDSVTVPIAGNFTDLDSSTLTYTIDPNNPLPLGLTLNPATGVISGTIDRNASQPSGGIYSVTVIASDGSQTASSTFTWTVTNPGPTAVNDSITIAEDPNLPVVISVLANDTDPDGDTLTVTSASSPNGTVVINGDGTISYTPKLNFNGTDIITYTISDGNGGFSTATVTVTVTAVNDAPTVVTPIADRNNVDAANVSVPTAASFNDLDGDTLTYSVGGLPAGLSINATTGVISGTIDKNASQPNGGVYSVTVTANDGKGGTVSTTFTWTVSNPGPTAVNDTATVAEDTPVTISVLANDTDPDGDTLTVTSASAGNGTVVVNGDGTITYTPKANFNGTDTITYTISDGNGGTSTATVTVTVTPANDAPVLNPPLPDLFDLDAEFVSTLFGNAFSDADGDTLSFTATGLPLGLQIDPATGTVFGQLDGLASQGGPGNNGVYTVTITASDGKGGTVTGTFTWTISNIAPDANDDIFITNEDVPITMSVLLNDTDPDGDPLTITNAVSTNGTVVNNGDGTLTFTPNPDFNGIATITYTITDGNGGFSTAVAQVTVNPVNDQPVGPTLSNQTGVDAQGGVSIALGGLFSDVDGDTLTFTATGLPAGLSISSTGIISGTIDRSASQTNGGVYAVTVTVSDGKGGTVDKQFFYTVTNPGPTAVNDTATTAEDAPVTISVLANDTDPDGDTLTVFAANAANGSVVINGDGTITYTPKANFNGTDTITYQISDGQGGTSVATVTVTVTPVNDAPVTSGLSPQNNVDGAVVSVPTAANFSDIDGDTLTYSASGLPAGLSINTTTGVISGTIDKAASQPNGGVYTVTVTASDGKGGTVSSTFAWNVTNPGPVAVNDTASTNEDAPVTVAVLTNDSDPDGDTLTVSTASAANGTVVINPNGTITYTPNPNFNGTDTITYTISDGNGGTAQATVTVTVAPVNDAPTVVAPLPAQNDADGSAVSFPTAGNFTDLDGDTLTFSESGLPLGLSINTTTGVISGTVDRNASQVNGGVYTVTVTASDGKGGTVSTTFTYTVTNPGPTAVNDTATTNEDTPVTVAVLANDTDPDGDLLTVTTASAANGTVVINPNGTVTYTPNANFNGTDTITYTISDGNGGTSQATVTVTVAPVNDPPVAKPDTATTNEDTPVTVAVLSNDTDIDGNPLTVTVATAPNGTVVINPDGTITYTPNANFNGTDTITYTISDGAGGFATSTVMVVVAPVNDAPVAVNDTATTNEDTPLKISPLLNDSDVDGDPLTITAASSPNGTVTVNPDGTITYVPNPNFNGTDVITYTISDGKGGTSTATITVTVAPVNDPPVAVNDTASTNEDTPVTVPVLANDTDLDGNPLTVTAATAANGTVVINPDGTVTYTPNANFFGVDTITYTISDGQGGSSTATVTVTVASVNDVPVAGNDTATTPEDAPVTIPVLANDSDADGDPLVVTAASAPNGTVVINPDGTVTYRPNPNFNGTDTITYTISDGRGGTTTATVTVTVTPVNDAPVAANDTAATFEDTLVAIAPLLNDTDPDADPLTITTANAPNGTVRIDSGGFILYTPNANFNGTDVITYTISDGAGGFSTATIAVTVISVNDPPVAVPDAATTNEETPVTVNVLGNDRDVEGDPLTVTAASAPNGTVTINPDGTLRYVPNANFFGNDVITYTISDGRGGFATSTVTMTVINTNDLPIAVNDVATTLEDTPVSLNVLVNDSDPDGNPLTVVRATAPNGTVVIGRDGLITYTPALNFNGTDVITYTITDGTGALVTATVTVTVTPVNDVPTDAGENVSAIGGSPLTIPVLANAADVDRDTLTVVSAVPSIGTAVINPDGTITFTAPADFDGIATIVYTISDGNGGFVTSTVTINVAQANADIGALLAIGEVNFPDDGRIDRPTRDFDQFINVPLIILDTVNGFQSLNGVTDLNVDSPLLAAVNGIRPLGGNVPLDVDGSPVDNVVGQIERILDFRFGMEKLFDPRFGDFAVEGMTGFSVRPQGLTDKQVMIESVVRDRVIYMEIRDVGTGNDPMIVEHQLRMRDGKPLPDWIHFDKRGLAIIERPADVDEIHLIVRSIRSDGKVIETPVVIQGATGEIQLDKPLKSAAAAPLDRTVQLAHGAAQREAERLATSFNS